LPLLGGRVSDERTWTLTRHESLLYFRDEWVWKKKGDLAKIVG